MDLYFALFECDRVVVGGMVTVRHSHTNAVFSERVEQIGGDYTPPTGSQEELNIFCLLNIACPFKVEIIAHYYF